MLNIADISNQTKLMTAAISMGSKKRMKRVINGVDSSSNQSTTAMVEGVKSFFKSTVEEIDDKSFQVLSNTGTYTD